MKTLSHEDLPALENFLEAKGRRNKNTETTYRYQANCLVEYLETAQYRSGRRLFQWRAKDAAAFRDWLFDEKKYSTSGVRLRMAFLKSYLAWAIEQELAPETVYLAFRVRVDRREETKVKLGLSPAQVSRFIESLPLESAYQRKMYALVLVCLDAGLRLSEVLSLKVEDLEFVSGGARGVVLGKGKKQRTFAIGPRAVSALMSTLHDRGMPTSGLVFSKSKQPDKAVTLRWVQQYIKEKAAKVGLEITPHLLRHTFALRVLGQTGDIRFVQTLLGHTDIRTTQNYVNARVHLDNTDRALALLENEEGTKGMVWK